MENDQTHGNIILVRCACILRADDRGGGGGGGVLNGRKNPERSGLEGVGPRDTATFSNLLLGDGRFVGGILRPTVSNHKY
jgi:hypothetical protein